MLIPLRLARSCAVQCGADTWGDMEDFGQAREEWQRTYFKFENGIPSHDPFGHASTALDSAAQRLACGAGCITTQWIEARRRNSNRCSRASRDARRRSSAILSRVGQSVV